MTKEPSDAVEIRKRRRADRRSRRWRRVRRIALALVVTLSGLVTWQTIQWQITRRSGESRLNAAIAETESGDPNWRLDRLTATRNQGLPPVEVNAAVQAYRAAMTIPKDVEQWQQKVEWRGKLKPGHLPNPEDLKDVRARLHEAKDALELARAVKRYPTGGFAHIPAEPDPLTTLLPKTQELRRTASLLDFDALVQACDTNGDAAFDAVQSILATGRGLGDEPTLISMLVRMAVAAIAVRSAERAVGLCEASDAKLAELQSVFAAEAEVPRMVYGTRGDRASFFRVIENVDNGSLSLESMSRSTPRGQTVWEKFISLPHRAIIPEQQAMYLEFYNRFLAAVKKPYGPPRRAEIDALMLDIISVPRSEYPLFHIFPALNKIDDADTRTAAILRVSAVALACERFRLKSGRFPESLDELPKELLSAVPSDPYTGNDILYRLTDTGAVVYCTGSDETDDGGELAPIPQPGFDIGFQMFDPQHRRRPPEPAPAPEQRE